MRFALYILAECTFKLMMYTDACICLWALSMNWLNRQWFLLLWLVVLDAVFEFVAVFDFVSHTFMQIIQD